jgi:hypothetical protein
VLCYHSLRLSLFKLALLLAGRRDFLAQFRRRTVEFVPLGTWAHRGNVELYFKHRYRRFQRPPGPLTEYFAFDDVKLVLRDLRRIKPKTLTDIERGVLASEATLVERAFFSQTRCYRRKHGTRCAV